MRRIFINTIVMSSVSLLLTTSSTLFAQEERWTHYGIRPLAMGNAFVAVADDYNALFYNPAGVARFKEWGGEFLNPYFELSNETRTLIQDASNLGGSSGGDTSAVLDLLESRTGKVQHLAVGLTPHLFFPGFGFGMGIDIHSTMVFHRYPTVSLDIGPDIIVPFAFGMNFLDERLSVGLGIKARLEAGIDQDFGIEDIELFTKKKSEDSATTDSNQPELKDFIYGGRGFGTDFGLLFTPFKPLEPTIGLSITDIGGTQFEKMDVSGKALSAPTPRQASVNTGFSVKPYQTPGSYFLVAIDAHSINQPFSFSKKLNFGSEFGFSRLIKLQMGLHQGYLSGGFQFDVRLLKVRFATYAEEMGPTAGTLGDRRYALQLKLLI